MNLRLLHTALIDRSVESYDLIDKRLRERYGSLFAFAFHWRRLNQIKKARAPIEITVRITMVFLCASQRGHTKRSRFVFSTSLLQTVSVGQRLGSRHYRGAMRYFITRTQAYASPLRIVFPTLCRCNSCITMSTKGRRECINHENSRNVITQCAFRNIADVLVKYYGNV